MKSCEYRRSLFGILFETCGTVLAVKFGYCVRVFVRVCSIHSSVLLDGHNNRCTPAALYDGPSFFVWECTHNVQGFLACTVRKSNNLGIN